MTTNGDLWRAHADRKGIPLQTVADVQKTMRLIRKEDARQAMARAMLKHGRLTDEARVWVAQEYPQ